jgi:methylated-DNA-protein-cysteine methyltransferase-like protein
LWSRVAASLTSTSRIVATLAYAASVEERHDPAAYVEAVLAVVERIPRGRVMSYGAIAEYLRDRFDRGSARRVGTIMARYGGPVPWHRVVAANGRLAPGHEVRARRLLQTEGVTFRGERVRMDEHAWWPDAMIRPSPEGVS